MKKILYTLGFAAMSLLALSCAKEEEMAPDTKPEVNGKYTLVADMESSVQTRTTPELVEGSTNQYRLHWTEGDKLSVFTLGLANKEFTLCDGAGTTTGIFAGNMTASDAIFCTVYPYNANHNLLDSYVMPSVYGDVDTEYTPNTNAHMMAGGAGFEDGATSEKMSFKHLGGVLALDLYGIPANVKGVVLTANKGITGEFPFMDSLVDEPVLVDGQPVLCSTESDGTNNSITIYFKPKATVRNEIFYFPLPVGTYQFKVEYIAADDQKILVIDSTRDNEIKRAGIKTMPELEVAPLAKISVSDETFTDAKISIDIAEGAGDFAYFMQLFGANVANMTKEEFEQKLNDTMLKNAVSSKNYMSDGKFEAANGSLLAWYKSFIGTSSSKLVSDQTVFVSLVPVLGYDAEGNAILDSNHIIYKLVTLKGYTISEDAKANVQIAYDSAAQTTTQVKATLTPDSGTSFRYTVTPLTQEQYDAVKNDNAEMLKKFGNSATSVKTGKVNFSYNCSPGQTLYLLVHAFDSNTGEGKIQVQKLESPKVTYNENIKLNLEVIHAGFRYADVKIEATGGELKYIRWGYMKKSAFESNATLKANGTELEKMMEIAQDQLAVNKVIAQRGVINNANLATDNLYSIENMYYEEDTYLFVIGYDNNDVPTQMDYELISINKADPLANFDASLKAPEVKGVYYVINSAGYKVDLSSWTNMNAADIATLDAAKGSYRLDLDWGEAGEPKRMWLSSDDYLNNPDKGLITGDAKHDALEVLKKRSGSAGGSGTAPDYYGRSASTGALSLTGVLAPGASENNKNLRNVITDQPTSPKTLFLVWETKDGKYGYMTVVPEDYAPSKVYMKPNLQWKRYNARFVAYFFNNENNTNTWVNMTDADGDGLYEALIPDGYPSVIFCRRNPGTEANAWDADIWAQTADLTVAKNQCYAMDYFGKGEWMSASNAMTVSQWPSEPTVSKNTVYLYAGPWADANAVLKAYFHKDGNDGTWVSMTPVAEFDGWYSCQIPTDKTTVVFVRLDPSKPDNNWDSKWNQTPDYKLSDINACCVVDWEYYATTKWEVEEDEGFPGFPGWPFNN